jgi:hypothetical protein
VVGVESEFSDQLWLWPSRTISKEICVGTNSLNS